MKEGEDTGKGCRRQIQIGMGAHELCGNIYYGSLLLCDACKAKQENQNKPVSASTCNN